MCWLIIVSLTESLVIEVIIIPARWLNEYVNVNMVFVKRLSTSFILYIYRTSFILYIENYVHSEMTGKCLRMSLRCRRSYNGSFNYKNVKIGNPLLNLRYWQKDNLFCGRNMKIPEDDARHTRSWDWLRRQRGRVAILWWSS